MLELIADSQVAADEVSLSEASVEVQSGVRQSQAGVVDGGHRSLETGREARVLTAKYRS